MDNDRGAQFSTITKVSYRSLTTLAALIALKVTLDLAYWFIVPLVNYYAIAARDFSLVKLLESYALLLLLYPFIPQSKKLSDFTLWMFILLSYVPMLTVYPFQDRSRVFMYGCTLFWVCVIGLKVLFKAVRDLPLLRPSQAKKTVILLYALLICFSFFLIFRYLSLSVIFDMTKVYEVRAKFNEAALPFRGYSLHWLANVFNTIFFALFIVQRRWLLLGCVILMQLLLASAIGYRTYFFVLPYVGVLMWVVSRPNPYRRVVSSIVAILWLSIALVLVSDDRQLFLFVAGTPLLAHAQLSFLYYDYYSTHAALPFEYIFNFYLKQPVFGAGAGLEPSYIIGRQYYDDVTLGAVTGVVGDGYMNLGFVGLGLWALLLAAILCAIDSCSIKLDRRIAIGAIAMPSMAITHTYLVRALFTSGLILGLVVLYLIMCSANAPSSATRMRPKSPVV